jgi:hypothetical protein
MVRGWRILKGFDFLSSIELFLPSTATLASAPPRRLSHPDLNLYYPFDLISLASKTKSLLIQPLSLKIHRSPPLPPVRMRFILLLKSGPAAEAGTPPTTAMIRAMMSFYRSMHTAGVVLAAEGLHASSAGARVTFHAPFGGSKGAAPTVLPGPFTPADSLVAGYWIINVKDLDEALGWAKKCPLEEEGAVIEVRRIAEMDDIHFEGSVTEEMKAEARGMRRETEERIGAGAESGEGCK